MKMIEVKTAELIGSALDWAVAQIEKPANLICLNSFNGGPRTRGNLPHYSADWRQGGSLINRHIVKLDTIRDCHPDRFIATTSGYPMGECRGETILIAACRAIVAAKLGDVVSVPAELVDGGGL